MTQHKIAILPGDGIGKETMPQAMRVLRAAVDATGVSIETEEFPWGAEHCLETGVLMPDDGVETLRQFDAIWFVAAGHPDLPDYRASWEFVFVIRKQFAQYINLRPVRTFAGVPTLLADQSHAVDMMIVRENSEGEYAGPGGVVHVGQPGELAVQTNVFTRMAIERAARFAFDLARTRRKHVTNVTKSNAILHGNVFWDRVVEEVAAEYPDVEYSLLLVDASTMKFIQSPGQFDVIVTTNQYGDILSDLGGAMVGSIGLSTSSNLNPMREYPSMFEPVHGTAPDIAGRGVANPIATILAGANMMEHLGEYESASTMRRAVEGALADGVKTGDLGGSASTAEMAEAVLARI